MANTIRVIQYGCGPIGCGIAVLAARRPDIELVGAFDIDPEKVGRDLGELAGLDQRLGVTVTDDLHGLIGRTNPNLAFLTTSSQLNVVIPQIQALLQAEINVLSSAEELSFPYREAPQRAALLDAVAKEHGVTVLATGINPGFLMDAWPLFMTAPCQTVEQVTVTRVQDASPRRLPFQKKIGAGLELDEFQRLVDEGTLRHVGLAESAAMIAAGLGWDLDEIIEEIFPVVAEEPVRSQYIAVEPGQAAGVRQMAHGFERGKEHITLDFQAYLGAADPRDEVEIAGNPPVHVVIKGGTHGDVGTAAVIVNSARRVLEAPAGLLTMMDLPLVACKVRGTEPAMVH